MAFGPDVVFLYEGHDRGTLTLTYLNNFAEAGIPATDALTMMTSNAAAAMGLAGIRRSVSVGAAADIIAVPGNPHSDLNALRSVNSVMKTWRSVQAGSTLILSAKDYRPRNSVTGPVHDNPVHAAGQRMSSIIGTVPSDRVLA